MAEGIDVRHSKRCTSRGADRCDCTPTYQAHVFDARAGKRLRKTFKTRTEAKRWRQEAIVALRHGDRPTVTAARGKTVREALDDLAEGMRAGTVLDRSGRRYRPATIRSYEEAARRYLVPALGPRRLADVRRADVQRLVDQMHAGGLAGSTIRNKLDPLRVVYRRAIQDEEVQRTPLDHLRLPALQTKPRAVVAPDRAAELLEMLPDAERPLWTILFYGGLRIGEARALRWTHVDFDQGVVRVEAGWDDAEGEQDTKTDAGVRVVPMTSRVRAELARHRLATGRGRGDLVFGRTKSDAFTRSTVRARAIKAWTGSGAVTPHEARHCAASYFAQAGLSLKEAQEALGHADPRTTMAIYQHALPGWQEGAAAKLDAYLGERRISN